MFLIYQDIDNKSNNEWFITKEIKEWCYKDRYKNTIVIGFLKEDGVVKWRSACRIYESNFIKKVIKKFESILNNSNIEIIDYNEKNNDLIINASRL